MRFLLIVAGMLTLAVSAPLTPANAGGNAGYGPHCFARIDGLAGRRICVQCIRQCHLKYSVSHDMALPPDVLACMATCVKASEATQR
jgi:hypothetical protein